MNREANCCRRNLVAGLIYICARLMVIPYSSRQFSGIHSNAVNGSAISVNYLRKTHKMENQYLNISLHTHREDKLVILCKKKKKGREEKRVDSLKAIYK